MKIFISYALEDKNEAGQLHDRLSLLGFQCFLAHRDMPKGAKWRDEIVKELKAADVFLPILTQAALSSAWVMQECGMAHLLKTNRKPLLILPLTVAFDVPPGCLEQYQSTRASKRFWSDKVKMEDDLGVLLAVEIIRRMPEAAVIKASAIKNLRGASVQSTDFVLAFLHRAGVVTPEDFFAMLAASTHNYAASYSDRAIANLHHYRDKYFEALCANRRAVDDWNRLFDRYRARKEEEKRQMEETLRHIKESQDKELAKIKAAQQSPTSTPGT